MCSWEGLLDLENEDYVVSLSLIWAGLNFSSLLLLSLSWSICPQGTTPAAQPGAHPSPASNPPDRRKPQEIFIGKMKGEGLSSVASLGWHWPHRPYLVGVMELSPYLIKRPQSDFHCYFISICCGEWLEVFKLQYFYFIYLYFWPRCEVCGILVP